MPHERGCSFYMQGGPVALAADGGEIAQDAPGSIADHYVAHDTLLGLLKRIGHSKAENKALEYEEGAKRGKKKLGKHVDNLFEGQGPAHEADPKQTEALKEHLSSLKEDPQKLLDIGGSIAPDHAVQIGAKAANAIQYLDQLAPKPIQGAPLDEPIPPSKMEEDAYNRQLAIANDPLSVLGHVHKGTVHKQDLTTINSLYPHLSNTLLTSVGNKLIDHKAKGGHLTYQQKQGLSTFLGQDLDSSLTPQSMQAIIKSQGPQQVANQTKGPKVNKAKATAAELKAVEKVDALYATPEEARLIDKKTA
jgi:hypothetical protein